MIDYDLELRRHHAAFRRALDVAPADRVLDVGCGAGETTREVALVAREGMVLGLDRSEAMIERARALSRDLGHVAFECADVEQYDFANDQFDLAISRFGTMFFADPIAAFSNIRRSLKPQGQLIMLVWQSHAQNEWAVEIQRALSAGAPSTQPFSLGDPQSVQRILEAAAFSDVRFTEVHEPVFYGPDTDSALAFVSQFLFVQEALQTSADPQRALENLRALLARHHGPDGVCFDSRAWIVSCRSDLS